MISKERCFSVVLTHIPEFTPYWQEHNVNWNGEEPGLCNDMSAFSDYAWEHIVNHESRPELLRRVFDLVEKLLIEGDQEVYDAAATCFLENLLNQASCSESALSVFLPLLGRKSREYCDEWDKFTGVRTRGLDADRDSQ